LIPRYSQRERIAALAIKKILDEVIAHGPWQANLFLQGIKKKLEELRVQFTADVGLDQIENGSSSLLNDNSSHVREVYISLYQSQGNNMQKWEKVIASLTRHSIGRPVYENEDDAKTGSHVTNKNHNHAYLVVKVDANAVLPNSPDTQPRIDRDGRRLVLLREGAIDLRSVVRLVHSTGQYKLVGNFLVKM